MLQFFPAQQLCRCYRDRSTCLSLPFPAWAVFIIASMCVVCDAFYGTGSMVFAKKLSGFTELFNRTSSEEVILVLQYQCFLYRSHGLGYRFVLSVCTQSMFWSEV